MQGDLSLNIEISYLAKILALTLPIEHNCCYSILVEAIENNSGEKREVKIQFFLQLHDTNHLRDNA
jgi:hypothetical protein